MWNWWNDKDRGTGVSGIGGMIRTGEQECVELVE